MSHTPNEPVTGRVGGPEDERSIGEIVSDLSQNFSTLVSQELTLAKAEAAQSAQRARDGDRHAAGHGTHQEGVPHAAPGSHDHPALGWAGLIMTVLWAIVAAILAFAGKSALQKVNGIPKTTETVSKIPNAVKGNEEKNR